MKLKDCCTIIAGQSPESRYYNTDGIGLPFFQGKADFGELYPSIRVYCSQPTKTAEKNDILLSVRAPVGPTNLAPCKVCIGRGLTAIRPSEMLLTRYVLLFFRYFEAQLASKGTGTTFKAITQDVVKNLEIPVPPIPEQQSIVARIEELFSQLDDAEATLQKTKVQLALYRQAVLKEAFQGKEQWDKYTFNDLLSGMRNGYGEKPTDSGDYKILRISAVRPLVLNLSDYRMNQGAFTEENLIQENDLLFTRYNGSQEYVGVCARVPSLDDDYAYPDKIIRCRLKQPGTILAKYLMYYLNSGDARKYIRSRIKTTSGQKGIAGGDIKRTTVYLPDGQKKKEIIDYIESRLSFCESIGQTVEDSILQIQALRRSILKQAFRGELQNEGI